jgi:SulP family sulfate permease
MSQAQASVGEQPDAGGDAPIKRRTRGRSRWLVLARNGFKDLVAGSVASIVLVANIVSFAALMFPGELGAGVPLAIWAMLIGSAVGGLWIAWATSIPPLATGIDSPTGAFLVLLSASAGTVLTSTGASPHTIVTTVMVIFTAATLMSGALLYLIGVFRWGSYFRFVPYFVVAAFLTATGWFLVVGGLRMTIGRALTPDKLMMAGSVTAAAKLIVAVGVLLVLLSVRRFSRSALAMPVSLVVMWIVASVVLHVMQLASAAQGWYLPTLGTLPLWLPFIDARATHFTAPMIVSLMPEFVAVAVVALISLVTKVSSLEVARHAAGDLDREFRAHGLANMVVAPLGGIACSLQTGTSRLLEQAGGATRASGMVAAAMLGVVAIAHLDLPALVPIPIIAGLVFYLGYTFIVDALARLVRQRAWRDLGLALMIAGVCIGYGYLVGVLAGVIAACVLFTINYARLGAVRRHATRREFESHVDRSVEASEHLRMAGEAIQIYWLSGYIFFGSSEGLFERIRRDVEALPRLRVAYVVLDFTMVAGADSSALASLTKLRNFCDRNGVTLVFCGMSRANQAMIELGGLVGRKARHKVFVDLNHGLAWCEDRVVEQARIEHGMDVEGFTAWLQDELGPGVRAAELMAYLERKDLQDSQVLYREGDPADTIDLVAVGNLAVEVARPLGKTLRVRRLMQHTVVGEMGFVRRSVRSATVLSSGPATVFTLTRAALERMRTERPDLAVVFDEFVMRALADRIDRANRAAAALAG